MRNLEILTQTTNTLNQLEAGEEILFSCLDDFTKQLFVYTSQHRMVVYSAASTTPTFKASFSMTDENPNLETSKVIQMDYLQEF